MQPSQDRATYEKQLYDVALRATQAYQRRDLEVAVTAHRELVALAPHFSEAHSNLGVALFELGRLEEAVVAFNQAIATKPDSAEAYSNLGYALQELGRHDEALSALRRAVALRGDFADAHSNLGSVLQDGGETGEAVREFRAAIAATPDHAKAHNNLAHMLLRLGDYAEGWKEYEWRWQSVGIPPRAFSQPAWDGGPCAGKTILLHAEQGIGDTLQFLRFVPAVAARGARIILEVHPDLVDLCRGLPVAEVVAAGAPLPAFDQYLSLLSLPRVLGTLLETIPADGAYLRVPPGRDAVFAGLLAPTGKLRIGVAWAGNPNHPHDRKRSVPAALFARLASVAGVQLYSLQVGGGDGGAALAGAIDLAPYLSTFAETAAAVAQLDLCISVDTALAHLAGALFRPVWVLLPFSPDWRWLVERTDSPWYPTATLFRQRRPDDWAGVFDQVAGALEGFAANGVDSEP